jgi:serine/threonine-protein kinase
MGTVWAGRHVNLGTLVAIKFIRPQFAERPDARRRFEIEARAAASVKSVHAVQVYDFGTTEGGLPYIVMEFLEGESLAETVQRVGPIAAGEVAKIISQASRALSKAHKAGIVHRDLKPDNVFLATNVENAESDLPYTVKLVDFGIAKIVDEPQGQTGLSGPTQAGSVIGTPNFMSPEQLTVGGAPDPLTDIWSLGATVYSAMIGRIPFEGEMLGDIVLKVCTAPIPVPSATNSALPAGFDAWFARACHRDRAKRFQTVEELADSLLRVCGVGADGIETATLSEDRVQYELKSKATSAELEALARMPAEGMSARSALIAGIIVGVALMVGVIGFFAWRESEATPETVPTTTSAPAPKK